MAAIFGLIGAHTPESVELMAGRLQHRGSSCHFETLDDRVAVGAIGSDPARMVFRTDQALTIAAGSIYAVDNDPEQPGSPRNIAELLQRRFEASGTAGLATIDGDFAAVTCNLKDRRILLFRDFFGCVPLFWSELGNEAIAFASEYKAILALASFRPDVDRSMLQYLQAAKRMPVGRTLLSNVSAVRPGSTLLEKGRTTDYQNFQPLSSKVSIRDEAAAKEAISTGFREALRRRSGTDHPIGLALSGGIDSIAMAFQLRNIFPDREIHTFSAGHGANDPEMATAAEVAAQIGAIHHPVLTPPALVTTLLEKLVWHMEDPTSRSEALQLMRIGEIASPFVDTLLSGQGTDGLFAGMPRHKLAGIANRLPLFKNALFDVFDFTQIGIEPGSLTGKAITATLFRGKVPPVPDIIDGGSIARPERHPFGRNFLNRMLAAGYQNSAFQDAVKFERPFGAAGVGYTSPCFDVSFARMSLTIDENLKILKGMEKYIFRSALSPLVPKQFLAIPKHPQRMDYGIAFADCLDQMADEVLSPESVKSRGLFEQKSIGRLRKRDPGRPYAAEAAMRLWTAIATELWARLFLDEDISPAQVTYTQEKAGARGLSR